MKYFLPCITICLLVALSFLPAHGQSENKQRTSYIAIVKGDYPLTLELSNDQWGALHTKMTDAVFASSASQIWPYFRNRGPVRVVIEHTEDRCYNLYKKPPNTVYYLYLTAEEFYWAQFVFQFSHEFSHTLCRPELRKDPFGNNQWFEEGICEASSVFVLRKLNKTWRNNPPFPGLKVFADSNYLRNYSNNLLAPSYSLPRNMPLKIWYAKNRLQLRAEWSKKNTDAPGALSGANGEINININRLHARLVGNYLLPLFEAHPENWDAISY